LERTAGTFHWRFKAGGREQTENLMRASQIESALRAAFGSPVAVSVIDDERWKLSMPTGAQDGYEIQGKICNLLVRIAEPTPATANDVPTVEFCEGASRPAMPP
jgi:hypothetical protein